MPASIATIKKPPTKEEISFLQEVIKGGDIEVKIPAEIDVKDWKNSTSIICRALRRSELQSQALLPVLGRLLMVAKDNQEKFYPNRKFDEFLQSDIYDKFGVGRSTCFEAMSFIRLDLPMASYEEIPRRNLKLLTQAIDKGSEKSAGAKKLVEKAAEMSEASFRAMLEKDHHINPSANIGTVVKIPGTKKAEGMWNGFKDSPEVQRFVGSDKPHRILEAMIEYCLGEFTAQGAALIEKDDKGGVTVEGVADPVMAE